MWGSLAGKSLLRTSFYTVWVFGGGMPMAALVTASAAEAIINIVQGRKIGRLERDRSESKGQMSISDYRR